MVDFDTSKKAMVSNKETVLNHEQGGEVAEDNAGGATHDLVNFKGIYYGDDN
jgi:hypothetical protein